MRVVREWVDELPLRMQSTMLLALRGPDNTTKHNLAKALIREMRFVVLYPAFPVEGEALGIDDFMGYQKGLCDWEIVEAFYNDHDQYPHHWLLHLAHAAEIIGQMHPEEPIRQFWWSVYTVMCHAFHMNPETLEQLELRLCRTNAEGH